MFTVELAIQEFGDQKPVDAVQAVGVLVVVGLDINLPGGMILQKSQPDVE